MPSGRCLPLLLGMYTRLTGLARQGIDDRWISAANLARSPGVRARSPSMPAVLRPLLCCVTRRTLTSVLLWLRSMSFCRLRTRLRSPSCAALKIRCRSRRTRPSHTAQSMLCQSRTSPSGPFTPASGKRPRPRSRPAPSPVASNLPLGSGIARSPPSTAHLTHVGALSGRATRTRIRRVIRRWVRCHTAAFPWPFDLPAFASWVILLPMRGWVFLTVDLPGGLSPGPQRGCHVPHP
jgi:hypothetical protein